MRDNGGGGKGGKRGEGERGGGGKRGEGDEAREKGQYVTHIIHP
jgi:hypothetical protein